MANSLDPDQARHFVGPDLDPNCLQRLSADDTSRQRVKPTCTGPHSAVCNVSDCRYLSDYRSRGREFNPAWSNTFVEIDHEIISTAILLPSSDSRVVVSYKQKYVHEVLVNCLVKL